MSRFRLVHGLCAGCLAAAGAGLWSLRDGGALTIGTEGVTAAVPAGGRRAGELHQARRSCDPAALDAVIGALRAAVAEDLGDLEGWHLLAEAYLERALQRSHLRGMAVGQPLFPELPDALVDDLDAGLAAVRRARDLGDDSGDIYRIEAGLMSQRITGLATGLKWNGRIREALAKAAERAADDPRLHVALGLRKMLVPPLLGQDLAAALRHFEFAAAALDDERPAIFAAMAADLLGQRSEAVAWLERALATNAKNAYARVVLGRLLRSEAEPFSRDVAAAELAATR